MKILLFCAARYIMRNKEITLIRRITMQKIMIIEDDPAVREELSLLLKNEATIPSWSPSFTILHSRPPRKCPT